MTTYSARAPKWTAIKAQLEADTGLPIAQALQGLWERHPSVTALSRHLGVSRPTLTLWLTSLGLTLGPTKAPSLVSVVPLGSLRVGDTIYLVKLRCPHCAHVWLPRIPHPKHCPRCQKNLSVKDTSVMQTSERRKP